jgi:hypothetical protein
MGYSGDLPPNLLELARGLEAGGELAPPHLLGPVTALSDLRGVAQAVQTGHGLLGNDDRVSVRDDLREMIGALGPEVRATASPGWDALRADLGRIPRLLETPDGALTILGLVDAVLANLRSQVLSVAAWTDVRTAFEHDDTSAAICELRVMQLAELVRHRGGDWRSTANEVKMILLDDAAVLARRGVVEKPPDDPTKQEPGGIPVQRRLEVAGEAIGDDPPHGEMLGWVCFANAWVPDAYLNVGGVEFYSDQVWPDGIRKGWPQHAAPRDEFDDEWHTLFFRSLPESPFALVAVPLGFGPIAGATDRARNIAQQLVRAARPHSGWKLEPGAAIYVRGEHSGWFGLPFDRHDRPEPPRSSPQNEPTGRELAQLDPSVATAVINGAPEVEAAVRDAEWAEAVAALPDARQRLALGLRLVERCLPSPAGDRWTRSVSRYLKEWWIDMQGRDLIGDVAVSSVDVLEAPHGMGTASTSWRERLTPWAIGLSYNIRLDETIRATGDLLDELETGSIRHRQAGELAGHTASAAAWLRFMDETGHAFDLLLARAARQRNAIVHGADTLDRVIESVADFVALMQSMLVHDQIAALAAKETLLARLETRRLALEKKRTRLLAGDDLINSILRPDPSEDPDDS